ncbi:MAG: Bug family tripartite tricarboxylate transporter substrate binding protein [Burkholderiales bacterium]
MNSNSSGTGLPVHVIVPVPRNGGSDIAPLLHSSLCRRACALVAALTLSVAFAASAQDYPSRPIRLIVASSPGSGVDIVARLVAQRMSEAIGVQIVADNRAGAGGTIGVQTAANSAPDGYTLLMAAPSLTINATLMRPPPYDPLRDFTPVGQATTSQYVIVVHPSVPVHNVKELIALAKAQPGKLNYGSGGPGNSTHLAGEYFKSLAKVDIVHVPYKGSGPAIVDLLGGQIQLMFANIVAVVPLIKSGKVRALAGSGPKRSLALPDIPTAVEAGLPGYVVTSWFGILAPARTPTRAITKLNAALDKVMRERDMQDKIASEGAEPAPSRPEEFGKLIASELAVWQKVIKAAGL